eukprot:Nk52_evm3s257 gene=Nk52_evmTU3s257
MSGKGRWANKFRQPTGTSSDNHNQPGEEEETRRGGGGAVDELEVNVDEELASSSDYSNCNDFFSPGKQSPKGKTSPLKSHQVYSNFDETFEMRNAGSAPARPSLHFAVTKEQFYVLVDKVFLELQRKFGFQKDNMTNQREHYLHLFHSRRGKLNDQEAMESIHSELVGEHSNLFSWTRAANIDEWDAKVDESLKDTIQPKMKAYEDLHVKNWARKRIVISSEQEAEGALREVALFLLVWGEASNVRHMPECVSFIYKLAVDYKGDDFPEGAFLDDVIQPLYDYIFNQGYFMNGKDIVFRQRNYTKKINYDDCNETFWSVDEILRVVTISKGGRPHRLMKYRKDKRYALLKDVDWGQSFSKTYKEIRTPIHVLVNFSRIWLLHLIAYTLSFTVESGFDDSDHASIGYVGFVCACFALLVDLCEMIFVARPAWKPIMFRLGCWSFLFIVNLITLILQQNCINSGNSCTGYTNTAYVVTILTFIVVVCIPKSLFPWNNHKAFISYYVRNSVWDTVASITIWVLTAALKVVLGYFVVYKHLFSAITDMWNASGFDECEDENLCEAGLKLTAIFFGLMGFVFYLVDTYIYYMLFTSLVGVIKGLALRIYNFSTWKSLFRSVPRLGTEKVFAKFSEKANNNRFPVMWNDIIDDMHERHLIQDKELNGLKYRVDNSTDSGTVLIPPTFFEDGKLPKNSEARRRLKYFAQSLKMKMPEPCSLSEMRSFTCVTPHYGEKIIYSQSDLYDTASGPTDSLLEYLKRMFRNEWDNLCLAEVNKMKPANGEIQHAQLAAIKEVGFATSDEENLLKVRLWASNRAQTLYRTVRGMMLYEKALRRLVDIEEPDLRGNFGSDKEYETYVDGLVRSKFTYLLAMQNYANFKGEMLNDTEVMLEKWPNINIAYIEKHKETDPKTGKDIFTYFSCLTDGHQEKNEDGRRQPRFRIRLPGNPILGDGKSDNQNTAIIYARGETLQAIDANQDHYLEECFKIRNLLEEFKYDHTWDKPVAMVGTREHIYSEKAGPLADVAAVKELIFGTLVQRVLARPHGMRLHYGHPDLLNKMFIMSRGGMSKATKGLNLSEDLYAGMVAVMRGGRIKHAEYTQCGKGRDMGFTQILGFVTKVARGAGELNLSREQFRLGTNLPLHQAFTFYYAHAGFHLNTVFTMLATVLFLLGLFAVAIFNETPSLTAGVIGISMDKIEDFMSRFLYYVIITIWVPLIPTILHLIFELGVLRCAGVIFRQVVSLMPVFDIFTLQLNSSQYLGDLKFGGAAYVQTGRGFATNRSPFYQLYGQYARTNIHLGFVLLVITIFSMLSLDWAPLIFMFIVISGLLFSPFLFNPHQFDGPGAFAEDYLAHMDWMFSDKYPEEAKLNSASGYSWMAWTRYSRIEITGQSSKGGKYVRQPSRLGLIFDRELVWPSIMFVYAILWNQFYYNLTPKVNGNIYNTDSLATFIITLFFPLVFSIVVLTFRQIVYPIVFTKNKKGTKGQNSKIITPHIVITLGTIAMYLIAFYLWDYDAQTVCRTIFSTVIVYNLLFKVTYHTMGPDMPGTIANDCFAICDWSGSDFKDNASGSELVLRLREFVCKVIEANFFVVDIIISHLIFSVVLFWSLVPYFDRFHTALLFWSSPFAPKAKRIQTAQEKSERKRAIGIVAVVWSVIIICIAAIAIVFWAI